MTTSACLAVVEADEAMLQVFALQWRAIDLRAKQLRNQCRQVELDEELDREERDLIHEHETLLRMKEKQLMQQRYEDRFKLTSATAAVRKLQQQTEQLHQRRESLLPLHELSPLSPAMSTLTAPAAKSANKAAKRGDGPNARPKATSGASSSSSAVNTMVPAKKATKTVAFSPSTGTHTSRSRRLEDSFNDEDDSHKAVAAPATRAPAKPSAADELMQMLAQDKASDSEGEATSLADLLFSPDASRPSSPRRGGASSNGTPSKSTPSKLARSVMKKALAAPLEFDFTRKAALAKAKAEREKQQRVAQSDGDSDASDDEPVDAETPSKKALKRRKDLGISFADRPTSAKTASKASGKTTSTSAATEVVRAATASGSGSKSLMEMIGAASLVAAKVPKLAETSAATTQSSTKSSAGAPDEPKTKKRTEPKAKKSGAGKEKTPSDASEPESEDFPGLGAANITKRAKPKPKAKSGRNTDVSDAPSNAKEKPQTKKASAVGSTGDMVSNMPQLLDIATPKIAGKKTKKLLFKSTSALAAKRTEFQQTLADTGVTTSSNDQSDDDATGVETPRKAPVMKRKRAQDAPGAAATSATATAYMQSPSVTALLAMRPSKSPIGIRYVPKTLKSPQIARKRPRTGDEPAGSDTAAAAPGATASAGPTTRPQRRAVRDTRGAAGGGLSASGVGASGLWGNSSASFFDAFVNGGAPRLKRSVVP